MTVERILARLAPYRDDFLDFEDPARILIAALREDRLPIPDVESLRHDFYAIERIARSRGR